MAALACPSAAYRIPYGDRLILPNRTGGRLTLYISKQQRSMLSATQGRSLRIQLPAGDFELTNEQGRLVHVDRLPEPFEQQVDDAYLLRSRLAHVGSEVIVTGIWNTSRSSCVAIGGFYPLTFKVTSDGLTYLCGSGSFALRGVGPSGIRSLGSGDDVAMWMPRLKSEDLLEREGAATALGWLAKTREERDQAVPALVEALKDESTDVRRNAAESLGRLGDERALRPLLTLTNERNEKDEWVREVADESVALIRLKTAAPKLPDDTALALLVTALGSRWSLVRKSACEALSKAGPSAVQPLAATLTDLDPEVRRAAAASLGEIANAPALAALEDALGKESEKAVKDELQKAIERARRFPPE